MCGPRRRAASRTVCKSALGGQQSVLASAVDHADIGRSGREAQFRASTQGHKAARVVAIAELLPNLTCGKVLAMTQLLYNRPNQALSTAVCAAGWQFSRLSITLSRERDDMERQSCWRYAHLGLSALEQICTLQYCTT